MKKHGKLRVASAALAVTLTAAALLPGLSGTDVFAVTQSQIDALEQQQEELQAKREELSLIHI